jgi:hypothetical protein
MVNTTRKPFCPFLRTLLDVWIYAKSLFLYEEIKELLTERAGSVILPGNSRFRQSSSQPITLYYVMYIRTNLAIFVNEV